MEWSSSRDNECLYKKLVLVRRPQDNSFPWALDNFPKEELRVHLSGMYICSTRPTQGLHSRSQLMELQLSLKISLVCKLEWYLLLQ